MNVTCPSCKSSYEVSDHSQGKNIICRNCNTGFVIPCASSINVEHKTLLENTTKKCPFCAENINVEAVKCRYCGEFLNDVSSSPELQQTHGYKVASMLPRSEKSFTLNAVGAGLILIGILLIMTVSSSFGILSIVTGFVLLAIGMTSCKMKCEYCGYEGEPKVTGGPSIFVFLLLLCLGLIPGLIYWFIVHPKCSCPKCGTVVIR